MTSPSGPVVVSRDAMMRPRLRWWAEEQEAMEIVE